MVYYAGDLSWGCLFWIQGFIFANVAKSRRELSEVSHSFFLMPLWWDLQAWEAWLSGVALLNFLLLFHSYKGQMLKTDTENIPWIC